MWKAYNLKKILFCFSLGLIGFYLGFSLNNDEPLLEKTHSIVLQVNYLEAFKKIFFTNVIVGFFISIIGFVTGGFITITIFLWNGFTLGILYKSLQNTHTDAYEIFVNQVLPHAPTEIFSFCLFGCIGLKGYNFLKDILFNSTVHWEHIPKAKELVFPLILLFISALIETFISS